MRYLLFLLFIFLSAFQDSTPVHFEKFKKLSYKSISFNYKLDTVKQIATITARLKKIKGLTDVTIKVVSRASDVNTAEVSLYRNKKRFACYHPIDYNGSFVVAPDHIKYADIDGNGFVDLKFYNGSGGCGLAADLCSKIYLMNKNDTNFTCFSFSDFAFENEYDLNEDGNYEILSCEHTNYKGHSYWIYNTYTFKNDSLINNSIEFNYPLWTRHLYYSWDKIAKVIPPNVIHKSIMKYPSDFYISRK